MDRSDAIDDSTIAKQSEKLVHMLPAGGRRASDTAASLI
jgi:hypothetical protein